MNKKSFGQKSRYKRLTLALTIAGSIGYLLMPSSIVSAAGQFGYDDEEFPPQYLDMDQFVITADRTPVNKWTTPANVITITDKDIEANHYQTLAEALNHVNGIIVPATSNIPVINGLEKVLILIDGHQLYNDGIDNRDTVELSAIPSMKNIKRIEIVKGGGSALYGSDAVTGIINIITKKGERNETTLDVNTGLWRQHNYEITNQGINGDFSWFITGGLHESHPFHYPSNVSRINNLEARESDRNDKTFTARFDYKFDDRNSLIISGAYIDHKYNGVQTYSPPNRYKSMSYNNILLVYNFKENSQTPGWLRYFNDAKFRDGYDDDRDRDRDTAEDMHKSDEGISKFRVQGVDYQNSWILGQNKIVTGAEWHQTSLTHWSWDYENKKISNTAFYLQDIISLGKQWKIIPGLRYDHNGEFGNQVSPKFAVNYRMDDSTKIYTSWGRVYKAPTPYQLYAAFKGSNNLSPEKGDTAVFGIEHGFGEKSSLNLSVFYADLNDAIDTKDNKYQNIKNEKSRGFEANFKQKVDDKWSYDIGFTYTKLDIDDFTPNRKFTQPRKTYSIGVHYDHGIWQANLFGIMGHGGFDSKFHTATKYAVLDFNVNCKVTDYATIYLKLNNLTNEQYSFYGVDKDSTTRAFISPGRSFIAGAEFKF